MERMTLNYLNEDLRSVIYLAASTKAVLMTFTGSIIPDSIMFTYSPDASKEGRNAQAN
jgi:hypothetical protein